MLVRSNLPSFEAQPRKVYANMPRARGRYHRVSDADRGRIVEAYQEGLDYVVCAAQLGVRRSTAYSIIRRFQETGATEAAARGGGRPPKMDSEMRDVMMLVDDLYPASRSRNEPSDANDVAAKAVRHADGYLATA